MGGFLSMLFSSPSKYDISKIERGFTKEQVLREFGEPEDVTVPGFACAEKWTYTVPFRIYATVSFDADGKVIETYRHGERVGS